MQERLFLHLLRFKFCVAKSCLKPGKDDSRLVPGLMNNVDERILQSSVPVN